MGIQIHSQKMKKKILLTTKDPMCQVNPGIQLALYYLNADKPLYLANIIQDINIDKYIRTIYNILISKRLLC